MLAKPLAPLFHLDQHLSRYQGIGVAHPASGPTLRDLVLEAHSGLGGVLPAPGGKQLLYEGLRLLLLVTAAAGNPEREGK